MTLDQFFEGFGAVMYLIVLSIVPLVALLELGNASLAIGLNLRNVYKGQPRRLLGHAAYLALPLAFTCIWVTIFFSSALVGFVVGLSCLLVIIGFGISFFRKSRKKVDPWWIKQFYDNFPGGF